MPIFPTNLSIKLGNKVYLYLSTGCKGLDDFYRKFGLAAAPQFQFSYKTSNRSARSFSMGIFIIIKANHGYKYYDTISLKCWAKRYGNYMKRHI